jgi:hypothetical protein
MGDESVRLAPLTALAGAFRTSQSGSAHGLSGGYGQNVNLDRQAKRVTSAERHVVHIRQLRCRWPSKALLAAH